MGLPPITNQHGQKSLTLYRVEPPHSWMTDVTIQSHGDLVITDGDSSNEWSLIVNANEKNTVIDALLESVDCALPDDPDERLLTALAAKFAGERCYNAIETFLLSIGIIPRSDCWLNS